MLNLDPDLLLSYAGIVTPEVARKLKFPSELGIMRPNIFRFMVAKEKALTYKEIKFKKLEKAKRDSGLHEIFEATNILVKATKGYRFESCAAHHLAPPPLPTSSTWIYTS